MASTYCRPADILPKALPFCVPQRMMELKRRPTLRDIRASGWQLRQRHAPADQAVPWDRVYFWPVKKVHVVTEQEVNAPAKRRRKRVAQKGPKVVKAPQTPAREKKIAAKFTVHYDYQRVVQYVKRHAVGARADRGALEAASADAADVVPTTTTPTSTPGAFPADAAAAAVDAQTESAAVDQAQLSLLAAVFKFGRELLFGPREPKRAHEDIDSNEAGDAKRRRVGSDAQAPARAEARPVAGKPARSTTTGATAPPNRNSTTSAAQRRARIAPKASLAECPPPEGSTSVAGNAKVVKALSLMPPPRAPARPIAGRPVRKRADTPDPGVPTPPPSDQQASSSTSTPTSSPSSSRSSSRASSRSPSPSPAASRSPSPAASRSPSPSPAPKRSGTSSPSPAPKRSGGSSSKAAQRKKPHRPHRSVPHYGTLLPPYIAWSRDEFVNPWDPRAPAAPDPVYPWAPASKKWANARPAPIVPLTAPGASTTVSFEPPTSLRDWPRDPRAPKDPAASTSSTGSRRASTSSRAPAAARRDRSASPAAEDFSGSDTEVESGSEDSGSDTDTDGEE